ncbi:MAG: universal stress protein [Armatimonadetes bacterium]|nr:universal stress protein [Armatimonadota bacterium]
MYKTVMVTLDGSELAEMALVHGLAIAAKFEAKLILFAVVESYQVYPQPGVVAPVAGVPIGADDEVAQVRDYLRSLAEQHDHTGLEIIVTVNQGDPATEICDHSRAVSADLIVMSTHGRSGIRRWVYGSVADRVLRGAPTPVLLVRTSSEQATETA